MGGYSDLNQGKPDSEYATSSERVEQSSNRAKSLRAKITEFLKNIPKRGKSTP